MLNSHVSIQPFDCVVNFKWREVMTDLSTFKPTFNCGLGCWRIMFYCNMGTNNHVV